jgi:hypothetical protein
MGVRETESESLRLGTSLPTANEAKPQATRSFFANRRMVSLREPCLREPPTASTVASIRRPSPVPRPDSAPQPPTGARKTPGVDWHFKAGLWKFDGFSVISCGILGFVSGGENPRINGAFVPAQSD